MLHRLIYSSQVAAPMSPDTIEALLAQARTANARRDITGALAFDSQHFLQVLEGSGEALNRLYAALMHDARHRDLRLIDFRAVEQRSFDQWSMAFAAADGRTGRICRRHSASSRLDPAAVTATAALQILQDMAALPAPAAVA
ncbi:BLUF domain-containing protein [Rubrivivax albus]|nr:BLUF domain-containing protein [Rubrivivax albus]